MKMAAFSSSLFLFIFIWNTELGAEGKKFHSGHCWIQKGILQDLWRAFQDMKNTVQNLDHNTDIRLLRQEFLRDASPTEICHLNYSLLNFYLSDIFNNYHSKATELGISKPLSTLANNFYAIWKKLRCCNERGMFSLSESSQKKFQSFRQEFTKLNPEARLTKALGEVDIFLAWMGKVSAIMLQPTC